MDNLMNEQIENADESSKQDNGSTPENWPKSQGAVLLPDGRVIIGRVGAPPQQEATSTKFFFWVPPDVLIEKTQLVVCESIIAGQNFKFYAIIDEVRRRSRKNNMSGEVDESDYDLSYIPPFASDGYTYAEASILRTSPPIFTSPQERSPVMLASPEDAQLAYGADDIKQPLQVGLIKNGGDRLIGPGVIDLDYLLGVNGGHMNVNGTAGRGTKSSFLLWVIRMLLYQSQEQKEKRPSDKHRLRVVPIILNVKNFDLFYIDRKNREFTLIKHQKAWYEFGIEDPKPFENVNYFAVQQPGNKLPIPTGRTENVYPYSWSLRNVIEQGLLLYLFAEIDANDVNFGALILDIENWLTNEKVENDGVITRSLHPSRLEDATFQGLLNWVNDQVGKKDDDRELRNHHTSTWKKLHRRLLKMVYESRGLLRRNDTQGNPLTIVKTDTSDPVVVDLAALAGQSELQRFVVATIFRQLVEARTGANAIPGLVYLVMLDELNRFAPRGAHDPITQLIETVAAEMRSQGIILLGAQQQASKVSEKVIENSAIRVLGMSGTLELSTPVWRFLSDSAKRKAASLRPDEKLVIQDNFREPMHVSVPFPAWAMNRGEAQNLSADEDDTTQEHIDE